MVTHACPCAIDSNDLESLKLLVEGGANIEGVSSGCYTPLSHAAVRGFDHAIEYLAQRGANIEARGEMNETPLIDAAFFGQAKSVALLLKLGANRSARNAFDQTALTVAKQQDWPDVVAILSD